VARNQQQTNNDGEQQRPPFNLRELFSREENQSDDESTSLDLEEPDDPTKPVESIDGLVKRLKAKPEEVYAIKVPMANGAEPMTIGELKDRIGELVDLDARELEFETRRVRVEGETLRAQKELRDLMAMIPRDKLSPELVNKVRQSHEATQTRERQLTLEHIPAWSDENRRLADLQGMSDMMKDYGFDETFLSAVVDHRAMKFIRDTFLIRQRITKALKDVKIPARKPGKQPSIRKGTPSKPTQNAGTRRQTIPTERTKIMELLNQD
jgi:hypothetical protein